MKAVLITTQWRGVFFGYAEDIAGETITITNARMAIYFGTERGLLELCETGPTAKSRISARSPEVQVRGVTAVFTVSDEAVKSWEAAP